MSGGEVEDRARVVGAPCPSCGGRTELEFLETSLMANGTLETAFVERCRSGVDGGVGCGWSRSDVAVGEVLRRTR